jgi:hypothetical protein
MAAIQRVAAHRRIVVEGVVHVHLFAPSLSHGWVSVAVMKMQLVALAGIAVYFICATAFAGTFVGFLPNS